MLGAVLEKLVLGVLCSMTLAGLPGCGAQSKTLPSEPNVCHDQHADGQAFAHDEGTTGWLFRQGGGPTIPEELEYVPEGYTSPAEHPGTLERLEYQTWESFSYDSHAQALTKTAWVHLPYGYTADQKYNVMYLSHGGWSNETTLMGTPDSPHPFKHIVDHAIEDRKIQPLIIVLPTYNNTSPSDSGDYSLALRLTDNFHNELVNDLIPAVESKYSTYAQSTDLEGLAASRDHRGFGGFSMGSMNTWRTFEHCLDYFRYFAPSSGGPIGDGAYMADIVRTSKYDPEDFFIFAASGTNDFSYSGFKGGVPGADGLPEWEPYTQADGATDLADVPDGQWYTQAIRWAASQNILTGYGNGRFGPGDPVSRQDMVTILWRYADKPQASAADFADEGSIDGYTAQAVDWARANEIINGVGDNKFDPAGIADRAQTAVILHNFLTLEG